MTAFKNYQKELSWASPILALFGNSGDETLYSPRLILELEKNYDGSCLIFQEPETEKISNNAFKLTPGIAFKTLLRLECNVSEPGDVFILS